MFLISTRLDKSPIHGVGVFTRGPIAAGAVVWRFEPAFDKTISEEAMRGFPLHIQEHVKIHAEHFPELGVYRLSSDDDKYMNHSSEPNLHVPDSDLLIALRDIAAGEELTIDYGQIGMIHHVDPRVDAQFAVAHRVSAQPRMKAA